MILTFLYFLLWLCLSIVLSLLVTIYIRLAWACPQLGVNSSQPNRVGIMDKCFEFGGNPSKTTVIALILCITHPFPPSGFPSLILYSTHIFFLSFLPLPIEPCSLSFTLPPCLLGLSVPSFPPPPTMSLSYCFNLVLYCFLWYFVTAGAIIEACVRDIGDLCTDVSLSTTLYQIKDLVCSVTIYASLSDRDEELD